MNLLKVLKSYLIFILAITAMASLSYIDSVRNFANDQFASVLNVAGYSEENGGSSSYAYTANYDWENLRDKREDTFESGNQNKQLINFETNPANDGAFAEPGTSGAAIMDLVFMNLESKLEINSLKFKINGVDPEQVKKAYIFVGEKLTALGSRQGDYIVFKNLDYKADVGRGATLSVKLDLGTDLHTGDRIRLDIEKSEDIDLRVGGEEYILNAYYPLKGEYLSISKPRAWSRPEKD